MQPEHVHALNKARNCRPTNKRLRADSRQTDCLDNWLADILEGTG
jgi:hypothetical protein